MTMACLVLTQSSCDQEKKETAGEVIEIEPDDLAGEAIVVPEKLATRLMRFVPREVEFVVGSRELIQIGDAVFEALNSMGDSEALLFKSVEKVEELDENGLVPDRAVVEENLDFVKALSREFFVCGWDGVGESLGKVSLLAGELDRWQVETIARIYLRFLEDEKPEEPDYAEFLPGEELLKPVEAFTLPKLLFGCAPDSREIGDLIRDQWVESFEKWLLKEDVRHERVEQMVSGSRFSGFKVGIFEEGEKAIFNEFVVLSGTIEEGLFFYLGPAEEALELPTREEDSISHHTATSLWDEFGNDGALGLVYASESLVSALAGFSTPTKYWSEIRKVFESEKPEFRQPILISKKLDFLASHEAVEIPLKSNAFAAIVYLDQGIHYQSRGGQAIVDDPAEAPWVLPDIDSLNPFLKIHFRTDEVRRRATLEYLEESFSLLGLLFNEWLEPSSAEILGEVKKTVVTLDEELKVLYRSWKNDVLAGLEPEHLLLLQLHEGKGEELVTPAALAVWPLKNRFRLQIGLDQIVGVFERAGVKILGAFPDLSNWPGIVREDVERTDLYRIEVPNESEVWSPTVAVDDRFLWISSSWKYLEELMKGFPKKERTDAASGFLVDVDLRQLMQLAGRWGERSGGKVKEFLDLFEVKYLRENLSRFQYWVRTENGVPRTTMKLEFRGSK